MTRNVTPTVQTYTYDQENRLTGAAGYTYTYDGDGNRVRKSNGNTAGDGTLYWYMTPGVVAESDLAGTLKSEYVFFDGERVARRDGATGTGGVFYYFSDHLKTASVITDSAGVIKAESDYYPWGGELQFVANDSNDYKFTGKKRDLETGLDYFGARYYSNGLGRWVSADWSATPVPVPYTDFYDPQTLNLYQFVGGNPASKADPDGHDGATGTVELVADKAVSTMLKGVARRMLLKAVAGAVASAAGAVEIGLKVKECIEIQTDINNTLADAEWQENVAANKLTQAQAQAQQQEAQETEKEPEPKTSTSGSGARKGGGTTSNGQATDRSGRKLGPSGKPIIHNIDHSSKKGAKDAARNGGNTKPMHHPSPKVGKPHYHSTVDGDKKNDGVHHNYSR
jgi:RHS repeat-associated protein